MYDDHVAGMMNRNTEKLITDWYEVHVAGEGHALLGKSL